MYILFLYVFIYLCFNMLCLLFYSFASSSWRYRNQLLQFATSWNATTWHAHAPTWAPRHATWPWASTTNGYASKGPPTWTTPHEDERTPATWYVSGQNFLLYPPYECTWGILRFSNCLSLRVVKKLILSFNISWTLNFSEKLKCHKTWTCWRPECCYILIFKLDS